MRCPIIPQSPNPSSAAAPAVTISSPINVTTPIKQVNGQIAKGLLGGPSIDPTHGLLPTVLQAGTLAASVLAAVFSGIGLLPLPPLPTGVVVG